MQNRKRVNHAVYQHSVQAFRDKQVMFRVLEKKQKCAISDISDAKTARIFLEFLIDQNEIIRTIFND